MSWKQSLGGALAWLCFSFQAATALAQQQPPATIYLEDFQTNQAANIVGAGTGYTCANPTIFIAQGTSTQLEALVSGSGGSSFVNIAPPPQRATTPSAIAPRTIPSTA